MLMIARACKYIQTSVTLLTALMNKLDEDDWGEMKQVLKYLKGTREMKLTLSVDDMTVVKWWV